MLKQKVFKLFLLTLSVFGQALFAGSEAGPRVARAPVGGQTFAARATSWVKRRTFSQWVLAAAALATAAAGGYYGYKHWQSGPSLPPPPPAPTEHSADEPLTWGSDHAAIVAPVRLPNGNQITFASLNLLAPKPFENDVKDLQRAFGPQNVGEQKEIVRIQQAASKRALARVAAERPDFILVQESSSKEAFCPSGYELVKDSYEETAPGFGTAVYRLETSRFNVVVEPETFRKQAAGAEKKVKIFCVVLEDSVNKKCDRQVYFALVHLSWSQDRKNVRQEAKSYNDVLQRIAGQVPHFVIGDFNLSAEQIKNEWMFESQHPSLKSPPGATSACVLQAGLEEQSDHVIAFPPEIVGKVKTIGDHQAVGKWLFHRLRKANPKFPEWGQISKPHKEWLDFCARFSPKVCCAFDQHAKDKAKPACKYAAKGDKCLYEHVLAETRLDLLCSRQECRNPDHNKQLDAWRENVLGK